MNVIKLIGDKNYRSVTINQMMSRHIQWDVCVTTFDVILSAPFFRKYQWHYVVIDEAHRLKNDKTISYKVIRDLPCRNRLLLTGTPLQNNLHELWLLLNYLMPGIFNNSNAFDASDDESMKCIQEIIKPFFLRRIKADVETTLLPKIEDKLFVGLTKLQRDTYIQMANKSSFKNTATAIQDLRKVANHPYLIRGVEPEPPFQIHGEHLINTSGKMMVLDKLLKHLKSKGSRALLFIQFADMIDIVEDYLDWRKYEYRRLDGQTKYLQRAEDIDEFNAENSNIFIYIISTHAAALGKCTQNYKIELSSFTHYQSVETQISFS